jgi:hypothetical protein
MNSPAPFLPKERTIPGSKALPTRENENLDASDEPQINPSFPQMRRQQRFPLPYGVLDLDGGCASSDSNPTTFAETTSAATELTMAREQQSGPGDGEAESRPSALTVEDPSPSKSPSPSPATSAEEPEPLTVDPNQQLPSRSPPSLLGGPQ